MGPPLLQVILTQFQNANGVDGVNQALGLHVVGAQGFADRWPYFTMQLVNKPSLDQLSSFFSDPCSTTPNIAFLLTSDGKTVSIPITVRHVASTLSQVHLQSDVSAIRVRSPYMFNPQGYISTAALLLLNNGSFDWLPPDPGLARGGWCIGPGYLSDVYMVVGNSAIQSDASGGSPVTVEGSNIGCSLWTGGVDAKAVVDGVAGNVAGTHSEFYAHTDVVYGQPRVGISEPMVFDATTPYPTAGATVHWSGWGTTPNPVEGCPNYVEIGPTSYLASVEDNFTAAMFSSDPPPQTRGRYVANGNSKGPSLDVTCWESSNMNLGFPWWFSGGVRPESTVSSDGKTIAGSYSTTFSTADRIVTDSWTWYLTAAEPTGNANVGPSALQPGGERVGPVVLPQACAALNLNECGVPALPLSR